MNRRAGVHAVWLLAAWLGGWGSSATPVAGEHAPLVVTQVPRSARSPVQAYEHDVLARPLDLHGARLVVWSPDGQVRCLSEGFESAGDPNVSFDGQRVLFAGRRPGERWRIWEIGLDGRGLRPISPEGLEARSPIHVSTLFTLDSPKPWFTTVFVGLDATLNEAGQPVASSLYNIKLDGTELRRLTFNPNANLDPFQMWDGRVLYAAERRPFEPASLEPHVGIYAIHIEGADMEFYGGGRGQRIQRTPIATETGLVVFVESDTPNAEGSGQLAALDESRPHVTHRTLTSDPAFVYRSPAPFQGSQVLVSRRPAASVGSWGIVRFDTAHGASAVLFDTPDFHEVQAVVAAPRGSPDGHSTVVETQHSTGLFYGLNCYDADARLAPHLGPGTVKRVRFIEGLPVPAAAGSSERPEPPYMRHRLVGEAPVEADGSFNVEVPADIPLLLQTLDGRGMALATCGWIWVKPREKRGCIGCHEDPERIPENQYVLSLQRPSTRLVLPPAQRRAITFRADIVPLLQRHCAAADCHGNAQHPLSLPLSAAEPSEADLRRAYQHLTAPHGQPGSEAADDGGKVRYVDAGRARTSLLAWHVVGANTAQPWDPPAAAPLQGTPIALMPPPDQGIPLRPEQLRTIIQWIDLGAPFDQPAVTPPPATRQP